MANSPNLAYCLEYSDHKTDMLDAFDDYLRNESMVDVMLSCEGNTIKAHKMVLSAGSAYFRNIFAAFKNPFQFPVLIIKDMPFRDLKAIVEFLYRGEVVVPVDQVPSLSKSAQTLFIKGLEKHFNKSAVVNVANSSNNSSKSNSKTPNRRPSNTMRRTANDLVNNSAKSKGKQTANQPNRSISMSLRNARRLDYRQLSNGDFSDGENSETDLNSNNQRSDRHSSQLRRQMRIKSELVSEQNSRRNTTEDDMEENSIINEDDNQSEAMVDRELEDEQNRSVSDSDNELQRPSTSRSGPSRQLKRGTNPITSKKVKPTMRAAPVSGDEDYIEMTSTATNSRPIKGDPENAEIVYCQLCPRVFSQASSLSIHMKRIHSEDKEHICKICGNQYSWRSGLYKHMKIHRK